jgi:hypothetical protein
VDWAGNVDASPARLAFVVDPGLRPGPPAAPRLAAATGTNGGARVAWQPAPDDGSGLSLPTAAAASGAAASGAAALLEFQVAGRTAVRGKSVATYRTVSNGDGALAADADFHGGSGGGTDGSSAAWLATALQPLPNENLYEFVVTSRSALGASAPSWPSDPRVPWDPSDPCSSIDCNDAPETYAPGGACFLTRTPLGLLKGYCVCRPGFAGPSCRDRLDFAGSGYYSATVAAVGAAPGAGYSPSVAGSSSGSGGGARTAGSDQSAMGATMASWWASPFGGCARTCGVAVAKSTRLRHVRCAR